MRKGYDKKYKASLILTPAPSVDQTFSEISTHFPEFVVLVFYTDSNPGARNFGDARVLNTQDLERELRRLAKASNDPKVSRSTPVGSLSNAV